MAQGNPKIRIARRCRSGTAPGCSALERVDGARARLRRRAVRDRQHRRHPARAASSRSAPTRCSPATPSSARVELAVQAHRRRAGLERAHTTSPSAPSSSSAGRGASCGSRPASRPRARARHRHRDHRRARLAPERGRGRRARSRRCSGSSSPSDDFLPEAFVARAPPPPPSASRSPATPPGRPPRAARRARARSSASAARGRAATTPCPRRRRRGHLPAPRPAGRARRAGERVRLESFFNNPPKKSLQSSAIWMADGPAARPERAAHRVHDRRLRGGRGQGGHALCSCAARRSTRSRPRCPTGAGDLRAEALRARRARAPSCSVIKDAGDDPDCTHGAELVAEVELRDASRASRSAAAPGVATVTKPGLGLEVGAPAMNPVPRRNITEMVAGGAAQARGLAGADGHDQRAAAARRWPSRPSTRASGCSAASHPRHERDREAVLDRGVQGERGAGDRRGARARASRRWC